MKCFCEDDVGGYRGKCGRCEPTSSKKFECGNKVQFETRDSANKEIYRLMKESFSNTTTLRSYKCKYCKKYHFTSKI